MMPKWTKILLTLTIISISSSQLAMAEAQTKDEAKPLSIADVMKQAHKKPNELLKKVATGKATEEQKKQLHTLYKALAATKPPKGTSESWKEKTGLLVAAADAAVKNEPDARRRLTSASNCTACHRTHK